MAYIDGFVIGVPTANKQIFIAHATAFDSAFVEHGETRVVECWDIDVPKGKATDFQGAVQARGDKTVAFSWIEWHDKASRDRVMQRMDQLGKTDERFDSAKNAMLFDSKRMIYGGSTRVAAIGK